MPVRLLVLCVALSGTAYAAEPPPEFVLDPGGHADFVSRFRFSADGTRLFTTGNDGTLRTWDTATGKPLRVVRSPRNLGDLQFRSGNPGVVDRAGMLFALACAPDGTLAVGGYGPVEEKWGTISLLPPNGGPRRTLHGHTETITELAFSPDGSRLASVSWDGVVRLWHVATGQGKVIRTGSEGKPYALAAVPGGGLLGVSEGVVYLWSFETGEALLPPVPMSPRLSSLVSTAMMVSYNTTLIAGGDDPEWLLAMRGEGVDDVSLRVRDGREVHRLRAVGRPIHSVGWGPDGATLFWSEAPLPGAAVPSRQFDLPRLRIGNAPAGPIPRRTAPAGSPFSIHHDEKKNELCLVNGQARQPLWLPQGAGRVLCWAILPDFRVVVGTRLGLFLYSHEYAPVNTGQPAHNVLNPTRWLGANATPVLALALSDDERFLLSGGGGRRPARLATGRPPAVVQSLPGR